MGVVVKRTFKVKPTNVKVILQCCECGVKEEIALKEYFGEVGICDQCDKMENYMEVLEVKVLVTI